MPGKDTPFSRVTRTSRRLNLALFGVLPLVLVLAGALFWGGQRFIKQEQERLELDFSILIGYVHEQEEFLKKLQIQNSRLGENTLRTPDRIVDVPTANKDGLQIFESQLGFVDMPFSLACDSGECPPRTSFIFAVGGYLSDFYSTFWGGSYYPAGTVFLVNRADSISMAVPAMDVDSGYEPLSQDLFLAVASALKRLSERPQPGARSPFPNVPTPGPLPSRDQVRWFSDPSVPRSMIGYLPARISEQVWGDRLGVAPDLVVGSLFSRDRINVFENAMRTPLYDAFWLTRQGTGVLIGNGVPPDIGAAGLSATRTGLVMRISDSTDTWTGFYQVKYASIFKANIWLPMVAFALLLLSVGAGVKFYRWYNRHVIEPARLAQNDIVESEQFSRTIIETAPIALCIFNRVDGTVAFGNTLAFEWLGVRADEGLRESEESRKLSNRIAQASSPGFLEEFHSSDGRLLHVAYAPTRYKKQSVILCAFADISARAEIERTLAQAKQEADKASEAKSTFLATMSHEIRTPLYGVLGTLELLGMTELDEEQRQHVGRIQSSSTILLQLISDILDITKIEAGQLALETLEFNPRELLQNCTGSYAGMAVQKGLLLFSCADPDLPERLAGDANRIQQILANLLSNAIKFTEVGHVIARMRAVREQDGTCRLFIQVVDSGPGIGSKEQTQLFVPFYQIDNSTHTIRGTGLGLSICARLVDLMQGAIRVTSEPGLGSSFSVELPLQLAGGGDTPRPDLTGIQVLVRTPHQELSENICLWLKRWGAQASPVPAGAQEIPPGQEDAVLVDVLTSDSAVPLAWPGMHLIAGVPGGRHHDSAQSIDGFSVDRIAEAIVRRIYGESMAPSVAQQDLPIPPVRLSVLVAEDNPINQVTLSKQLERLNCTVALASDGIEALAEWDAGTYDVLLTDVNMPRMNGYELASALRAKGVTKPIIGVTANAMRDEEARCLASGMSAWLVKPIALRTLYQHLRGIPPLPPAPGTPEASGPEASGPEEALADLFYEAAVPAKYQALFFATMKTDLERLEAAIAGADAGGAGSLLHRIKGAVVVLGMRKMAERLDLLERLVRKDALEKHVVTGIEEFIVGFRNYEAAVRASSGKDARPA